MNAPPILFDTRLLSWRLRRAALAPADFLHREIAAQVQERLLEVNKAFPDRIVVGNHPQIWAGALQARPVDCADLQAIEPESVDLAVHALALHWANDPVGQLVQARRALRPDGLMIAALFAGQTLHELRAAFAEAEIETTGGISPRIAPMGEIRDLGGLIQRAGLALPVADSVLLRVTYADTVALMRDLRAMGETNIMVERRRSPLRRDTLRRTTEIYQARFAQPDGRIPATFEVVFLTGWAPSANQQRPLRPGSATTRLADALNPAEPFVATKPRTD